MCLTINVTNSQISTINSIEIGENMKKYVIIVLITMMIGGGSLLYYYQIVRPANMTFPAGMTLQTSEGQDFSFDEMKPKLRFVEFFYLGCPDVCPTTTASMQWIRDKLVENGVFGSKVEFLSITIDPEQDTIEMLSSYGKAFKTDITPGWYLLRGSLDETKKLTDKFKFFYQNTSGQVIHSNASFLLDRNNQVINEFGMGDVDFDREQIYQEIMNAIN